MKSRHVSFWNLGRLLDQAKDRAGKYSLRKVNQFPKVNQTPRSPALVAKAPAPVAVTAPTALDHMPSEWIASAPRPSQCPVAAEDAVPVAPISVDWQGEASEEVVASAPLPSPSQSCGGKGDGDQDGSGEPCGNIDLGNSLPDPLLHPNMEERALDRAPVPAPAANPFSDGSASLQPSLFAAPATPSVAVPSVRGTAPKFQFRPVAGLKAGWQAISAFAASTRVRFRAKPRPAASPPRAQAELALEKVTVLRNDLSDADFEVVAVQQKLGAAKAESAATGTNAWARVTGRWPKSPFALRGEGVRPVVSPVVAAPLTPEVPRPEKVEQSQP